MTYNPWPLGDIPADFRRKELEDLKAYGYQYNDAREIVSLFETKLAAYAGARYAVTVDCASHGLFLSLVFRSSPHNLIIPSRTYVSVPMQILYAGYSFSFEDIEWSGIYELGDTGIFDGSARFRPNMFVGGEKTLQVLSFQIKKRLPIGRGGAILTNDVEAYDWLRLARYDGRDLGTPYDSAIHVRQLGWHMYMTPEDAARGLILFEKLGNTYFEDIANSDSYPDLRNWFYNFGLDFRSMKWLKGLE